MEAALSSYVDAINAPEPAHLWALRRFTHLHALYPQMLPTVWQGRLLALLSRLVQPRRVLEIGTYTGYSAQCLAEGLVPGGKLITIERDPERAWIIAPHLQAAGLQEQIEVRYGPALELLPEVEGPLDLVYLDADKAEYLAYYEAVLPRLRRGGLLLADNVLWHGKVAQPGRGDKATEGLRAFNAHLQRDGRVQSVLLPLADGCTMAWKR
ncbi:MAG: O-methyltransferase [Bacteroidetes bacterium]|nr:MAG: O-methyltransferase [Bacteroidota bacterium]